MTDFNASDQDVNRAIRSWLHEDRHEDASRIAGAVLDRVEATPRRRATWWPARRSPIMNRFLTYGLGSAAVVVLGLFLGYQLLGSPSDGLGAPGGEPTPTSAASATDSSPSPSAAWRPLPRGECVELEAGTYLAAIGDFSVTMSIPTEWKGGGDREGFYVNSRGSCLFAGGVSLGASLVSYVSSSACDGQGEAIEADTPAAVTAALAAQTGHETIGPSETTFAGYPASRFQFSLPGGAESCNGGPLWLTPGGREGPGMYSFDGSGSFVTIYVVDVDGTALGLVIDSGVPDRPADLTELDAIVDSITFDEP